jgi:hypothetical protein
MAGPDLVWSEERYLWFYRGVTLEDWNIECLGKVLMDLAFRSLQISNYHIMKFILFSQRKMHSSNWRFKVTRCTNTNLWPQNGD